MSFCQSYFSEHYFAHFLSLEYHSTEYCSAEVGHLNVVLPCVILPNVVSPPCNTENASYCRLLRYILTNRWKKLKKVFLWSFYVLFIPHFAMQFYNLILQCIFALYALTLGEGAMSELILILWQSPFRERAHPFMKPFFLCQFLIALKWSSLQKMSK